MDWILIKLLRHLRKWIYKDGNENNQYLSRTIVEAIDKLIEYLKKPD